MRSDGKNVPAGQKSMKNSWVGPGVAFLTAAGVTVLLLLMR